MRLAVDTGGTFTDLVVETDDRRFHLFKTPTIMEDPAASVLEVVRLAAQALGRAVPELLGQADLLIHGTTCGLNAILTGDVARTAFVTTQGHPDILLFREGGRRDPFNHTRRYPPPYVPRKRTYEVVERVGADGSVLIELDEGDALRIIERLAADHIEAVGVCFLWSIMNPVHENRFGELLAQRLPSVPCTLSHRLNPAVREYRRASSACIDASLKPLISKYLTDLGHSLGEAGFSGRPLMVTSGGGVLDFEDVVKAPIHSLRSGPAMAPVAGRHYARGETALDSVIIADAGGTSYDVSLLRGNRIPRTREAWIGEEFAGHITGFPAIDVKSIGAGGGSIAWVDPGGLIHVGPESAGSDPGPACYGRGGIRPTVTDASLVLGYLDPASFLGGRMLLDRDAAEQALIQDIATRLDLDLPESAAAVLRVMTEQMVQAIEEITVRQGVASESAILVAGGGSAGLNAVALARRLGCPLVLVPEIAAGLSAAGALLSELLFETQITHPTTSADFDLAAANAVLAELASRCTSFLAGPGSGALSSSVEFHAEARYPDQVWELEVPLRHDAFGSSQDVDAFCQDFHRVHRETFAVADISSRVEIVTWGARARCRLHPDVEPVGSFETKSSLVGRRLAYFDGEQVECNVHDFAALELGAQVDGPALIESPSTTIVIPAGASIARSQTGSLRLNPCARARLTVAP